MPDKHMVKLGTQCKNFTLHVARREGETTSLPVRREFDINPPVTLVGKRCLLQHSVLESQRVRTHKVLGLTAENE
jgi:hypothetical protein